MQRTSSVVNCLMSCYAGICIITPPWLSTNSLPDTFTKLFLHKRLRGWLIVYSLERATHPEGACYERQPPQVSCHTGCLNTMLSWPAVSHGRQALDHPCGAHQRHRGQQEYPAAAHRRESAQRHQTRKPRQTLCAVVRQRPHPGGGLLSALCGGLAASSRLADVGARHGWQRRGPW